MAIRNERKIIGLPRLSKGSKLLLIKTSKRGVFIVQRLPKVRTPR